MNPINKALLLALLVGCALARSAVDFRRIVGGEDAKAGQFPHQVSLRNRITNFDFCGGSIISTRFILSAAHCTKGLDVEPKNVYVVVGALSLLSGGIEMALDQIVEHQNFSRRTMKNDISLLRTVESIVYSELVKPIALPTKDYGHFAVTVSGWGRNSFPTPPGASDVPDILQFASGETLSIAECKKSLQDIEIENDVSEKNVCAINPKGVGACSGDSGGPLISDGDKILVGVVSWSIKPCGNGLPEVYTNVYKHLDWIHSEVAKRGGSIP